MAENAELTERIEKMLAEEFDMDVEQMTDDTRLEEFDVTSLEFVELLFKVEQEFGVSIDVSELPELYTVGEVKEFLSTRLNESE